jgi:hypothetical protein
MAARSPETLCSIKRLSGGWYVPPQSNLRAETEPIRSLFGTHNQLYAV